MGKTFPIEMGNTMAELCGEYSTIFGHITARTRFDFFVAGKEASFDKGLPGVCDRAEDDKKKTRQSSITADGLRYFRMTLCIL